MLFLLFELGSDRYALDVRQVSAVLPLVTITQIPQAPPAVAGLVDYRGTAVPVIDLQQLTLGRPARRRLSTRLVLVHYTDPGGTTRLLGLIAEKATETMRREDSDFAPSGVTTEGAPYLGPVTTDARGVVQRIDVQTLLPAELRDLLFRETAGR
jgi:chemotaxis-related protein WspB